MLIMRNPDKANKDIARRGRQARVISVVALLCLAGMTVAQHATAQVPKQISAASEKSLLIPQETPSVFPSPACGLAWRVVSSPNPGINRNQLSAVSAVSATDIWAVGTYQGVSGSPERPLTLHWDGSNWTHIPSPDPSGTIGLLFLHGVSARAPNDVWAVGDYLDDDTGTRSTLIEHWNGSSWTIVPGPNPTPEGNLLGVAAIAADNAWAVGMRRTGPNTGQTLIEHWDGQAWSVIPSPNPPNAQQSVLWGVSALAPDNIWAVGHTILNIGIIETLVQHWDGTDWSIVDAPDPGESENGFFGVAGIAPNDVWAVGYSLYDNQIVTTLIEHWDGTSWSVVTSPNIGSNGNQLNSISALASNDAWTVGYYRGPAPTYTEQTLIEHWDGTNWSIVPSPNMEPGDNILRGVDAVSTGDVWTVGRYTQTEPTFQPYNLIERYNDPCAVTTPTTTATSTPTTTATTSPVTTITPIVTVTSTATQAPCTITFTDVPEGSTFYANIRCLACQGIISGYTDGTFRPNNEVTRGQLAKIVSNAAGFIEDPNPQIFEDVTSSNTFYQWINRLARRGHMSGYTCGGPGEPCTSGLPYFRPSANATRGQTSKIVSNAAGYSEIPTDQTFEDVPSTHTFYREIQRLATRNIMQGYPCGGAGEPCVSGKPYFRPANNVTRGQSAKIVANTFFPGCDTPQSLLDLQGR